MERPTKYRKRKQTEDLREDKLCISNKLPRKGSSQNALLCSYADKVAVADYVRDTRGVMTPFMQQLLAVMSDSWRDSSRVDRSERNDFFIRREGRVKEAFLAFFRGGIFSLVVSLSERTSSELLGHESSLSEDKLVRRDGVRSICVS